MQKILLVPALATALTCFACSDDTVAPDGAALEASVDLPVSDAGVDLKLTDTTPDAGSDGPVPDAPAPDLFVSDGPPPPAHSWCATPKKLALSGGKITVSGNTSGAANQYPTLSCNNPNGPWPGPQLYYQVALQANKTYRATLTPGKGLDAALYAFPAGTACGAAAVDNACTAYSSDVIGAGAAGVEKVTITPTSAGDWVLAVDSHSKTASGAFTLTVAEHAPPANTACAKATEIKLSAGKGSVSGDTSGATNEYGNNISCGGYTYMAGPQLYYKVALKAKQAYKLTLNAAFYGQLYVFPVNGCGSTSSINKACGGSNGKKMGPVGPNTPWSMVFTPTVSGTYVVAVDSASSLQAGSFTLAVSTFATAKNGKCSAAQALKLTAGAATGLGDTSGVKNEHSSVKCGGAYALNGSQVYYKVTLAAAKTYRLALTPSFSGYVHIVPGGSCTKDGKKIDTACKSKGKTGDVAGPVGPGKTGELYFTSQKGGSHVIAVDSLGGGESGSFKLDVAEFALKAPASFTAPLCWDFDSACQTLGATGDWQCGAYAFSAGATCDAPAATSAPKAPRSGSGMWGTVLNSCHKPASNASAPCANKNPYDDSLLYFAVTIPGTWKTATLTYWSWDDYFLPYDWSEVRVNGAVVGQTCKTKASTVAWTKRTVDLSKHAGKTVTVSFHFAASSAVNYSGWYIDDLSITGK